MANDYFDFSIKQRLILRDGNKCFYCGHTFSNNMEGWNDMSVDHMTSQKDGGSDSIENLCLSCGSCNSTKKEKSFVKGSIELFQFQHHRHKIRAKDEEWAFNMFSFLEKQRQKGNKEWPDVKNQLITALSKMPGIHVTSCDKAQDSDWVKIEFNNKTWYFHPKMYFLQAYFTFLLKDKGIPDYDKKRLSTESLGYHDASYPSIKYIYPFDNSEIDKGAKTVYREMEQVNKIWMQDK